MMIDQNDPTEKTRDWYVTLFEYGVMWPIGLWGIAGIVYYFFSEPYGNDELVAAILLAAVAWYRFRPLPSKSPAPTTDAPKQPDRD